MLVVLPAVGAMLSGSTPVCYTLVLETIKHNNTIIKFGKKDAYISIYIVNVRILFEFENHINKILVPNRSELFSITKNQILFRNIVVSYKRSGLASEAYIGGRIRNIFLRVKFTIDVQIKCFGLLWRKKYGWKRVKGNLYL